VRVLDGASRHPEISPAVARAAWQLVDKLKPKHVRRNAVSTFRSSSVSAPSAGQRIHTLWRRLEQLPGGQRLFAALLRRMVPYSGSTRALVRALRPGYARVELRDRRRVRNHLGSVHAVALANVGELASGLATVVALPPDRRAILTRLTAEYLKKARGTLTAEGRVDPEALADIADGECEVVAEIRDAAGEVVARVRARWLVGRAASAQPPSSR
jgi:acyl-coenzyme A thioesterase PaaI-like protein